ncbi:MAG TPA: TIGR03086 family metal-binding protein [Acidimicrobiales bacterium]
MDEATEIQPEDEILREEMADRFRRVAAGMTERVLAVPAERWDDPAPCEGWVARDVIDHLAQWLPAFYCGSFGVLIPRLPSAADDPVTAWVDLRDFLQASIDDPDVAFRTGATPLGDTFAGAFHAAVTDVLVHTWDLARATGLDDRLDADEVHRQVEHLDDMPFDAMVASGHYGAPTEVPAGADEQTRLLAALGRNP